MYSTVFQDKQASFWILFFAVQKVIKAETHTSFSFGHPAQPQLTFSSMSTGTIPKKGLIAIAGMISAFSSEGRGAMQMPPVSGRKIKNKIYVVHPQLGESKFRLFLGQEENSEATLQEKATGNDFCRTKKHRHLKAAQAWYGEYSAAPLPTQKWFYRESISMSGDLSPSSVSTAV